MTNKSTRDWELERYLIGELPRRRMEEIKKLIRENPELQKRIESLQQSNQQILKQYQPESVIPEILERYEEEKRLEGIKVRIKPFGWRGILYAVPALAAALLIVFVVFLNRGTPPPDIRIKGEEAIDYTRTQILIYRKIANEVELLREGDQAKAGDLLQIAYVPAGMSQGVILSLDGNGVVTLHYPENKDEPCILKTEKKVLLRNSYELDDAPVYERFFFITAMDDIDVSKVIELVEDLASSPYLAKEGNLDLPEKYSQFSILLNKGERQ